MAKPKKGVIPPQFRAHVKKKSTATKNVKSGKKGTSSMPAGLKAYLAKKKKK